MSHQEEVNNFTLISISPLHLEKILRYNILTVYTNLSFLSMMSVLHFSFSSLILTSVIAAQTAVTHTKTAKNLTLMLFFLSFSDKNK